MLAKLLFRPLGSFFGVYLARKVGNRAFDSTWERRYGTQAPTSTTDQATWPQVGFDAIIATQPRLGRLAARLMMRTFEAHEVSPNGIRGWRVVPIAAPFS